MRLRQPVRGQPVDGESPSAPLAWSRPLVASPLPLRCADAARSVKRPPASSTITDTAARSQSVDLRVGGDLGGTLGHQHVLPGIADTRACASRPGRASRARRAGRQRPSPRFRSTPSWASDSRAIAENVDRAAVGERAAAPASPTSAARSAGIETTPTDISPSAAQRDQGRPGRHPAHVALGAVDRVDDPARARQSRPAPARRRTPRR